MLLDDTISGREVCPGGIGVLHGLDRDDAGRLAFLAEHLRLPVPAGALAEVPLGYWPDGSVRRVEGGAGRYVDEGQILSGTIDAMWAEPSGIQIIDGSAVVVDYTSTLWIVDWKTGAEEHVQPVDRNWQLRGAAVLAARWTGARRVIPAICYVNAGECAEAVREGRVYTGRWEVGAPLDAAALDAAEAEMRVVLARARGECDGEPASNPAGEPAAEDGDAAAVRLPVARAHGAGPRRSLSAPRLILGPHCDHCPARGACPALAAEAVTLLGALEGEDDGEPKTDQAGERSAAGRDARGGAGAAGSGAGDGVVPASGMLRRVPGEPDQGWEHALPRLPEAVPVGVPGGQEVAAPRGPGLALTPARAAHLAAVIPALRGILDAAEVAVRAHVHATGRPLTLANGQEYGPAVEPVRHYRTGETFEALAARVGDARANEAFVATPDRLKAALRGDAARLPRGAWTAFEEELEARGAVVVGAREVWRKRWPAKPAEVAEHEHGNASTGVVGAGSAGAGRGRVALGGGDPGAEAGERASAEGASGGGAPQRDPGLTDASPMAPGARADDVPPGVRDEAPADGGAGVAAPGAAVGGPARPLDGGRPAVSRAPCSVCGCDVAATTKGVARAHPAPGLAIRCAGSGRPPARAPEQLQIDGA
jgi:hypothetical protein